MTSHLRKSIQDELALIREKRNNYTKAGNENLSIYVNPNCSSRKIILNKDLLLNPRSMDTIRTTSIINKERIYCNPKFLQKPQSCNNQNNINLNFNNLININNTGLLNQFSINHSKSDINSSGGIHINPEFLKQQRKFQCLEPVQVPNYCLKSNNQCKIEDVLTNEKKLTYPTVEKKISQQQIGTKYKLINITKSIQPKQQNNITKGICFKTKYSLKRLNINEGRENNKNIKSIPGQIVKMKAVQHNLNKQGQLSSEFKKLSSTKLVRKSVLQSLILARRCSSHNIYRKAIKNFTYNIKKSPMKTVFKKNNGTTKKKTINLTYFPKKDKCTSIDNINNNSFKRLSKTKIVRKSLFKVRLEAQQKKLLKKHQRMSYISKYLLRNDCLRRKYVVKQRALLKWRKKKQSLTSLKGPSTGRIKCKKGNNTTPSSKQLKKNNQPCPFYNRFGRCKGKDRGTCPKLHDEKYISICRKLLQGECDSKDCLLSHDVRPGKMPTCHHYLAGLCTRSNCPFLHIKVNPKAPICTAFLQGFCPDVFNCLKRHEFICPIYAEKGNCPRGKSCTYPHRTQIIHSKLLKDDQKPLINHKQQLTIDSKNEVSDSHHHQIKKTLIDSNCNNENDNNSIENTKKCKKKIINDKTTFKRYFTVTSTDDVENSCDEQDARD